MHWLGIQPRGSRLSSFVPYQYLQTMYSLPYVVSTWRIMRLSILSSCTTVWFSVLSFSLVRIICCSLVAEKVLRCRHGLLGTFITLKLLAWHYLWAKVRWLSRNRVKNHALCIAAANYPRWSNPFDSDFLYTYLSFQQFSIPTKQQTKLWLLEVGPETFNLHLGLWATMVDSCKSFAFILYIYRLLSRLRCPSLSKHLLKEGIKHV